LKNKQKAKKRKTNSKQIQKVKRKEDSIQPLLSGIKETKERRDEKKNVCLFFIVKQRQAEAKKISKRVNQPKNH